MGEIDEDEVYFPRGGADDQKRKSLKNDKTYVFESNKPPRVPKKNPGRKERQRENAKKIALENLEVEDDSSEVDNFHIFDVFSYKNLRDGTLSMCSIMEVKSQYLVVALPERLIARVPFDHVSEPFKKLMEQNPTEFPDLKQYFPTGYCVPCRIKEVSKHYEDYVVIASTDPNLTNSYISFNLICVGFTLIAAVQSCEDHGYVMSTGVTGLKAFLPHSKTENYLDKYNSGKKLGVGQLVWCKVLKSNLSELSNMVELTIEPQEVSKARLKTVPSSEVLIPGVQVNVTVTKVTHKLLYVREITTSIKGYIPSSHLENVWSKTSDYQVGTEHSVCVLYKFPLVDAVCYSMVIKPNTICLPEVKKGTLFNRAKIISKDGRGVFVQFEDNEPYKGVISTVKLKKTMDDQKIDEQFPLGNHITVRVLNFHYLERIYSCTSSDEILQKGGHPSEYKPGQLIDVKIIKTTVKGVLGTIGNTRVKAFIPLCHITDSVSSEPEKKIIVDEVYNGRVWLINEKKISVVVTLCPSLVNNKPLINFKKIKIGDEYYGIISKTLNHGIVITFFNDLKVFIPEVGLKKSPQKYKVGKVVKCYMIGIGKDGNPRFSLTKPLDLLHLKIGNNYPIMVKGVSNKGLNCIVLDNKEAMDCFLPTEHLCDCLKLTPFLLKKYEIGTKIDDAILYSYEGKTPIFSLKYTVKKFFEQNEQIKENGFSALKKDDCIPATIYSIDGNTMLLYVPIPQYNGKISANIPKEFKTFLKPKQGVNVVVTKVNSNSKEFFVEVQRVNPSLTRIRKEIKCFLIELSNHISRIPGETLVVKVKAFDENTINVLLPDKSEGVISNRGNKKFKVGEKIFVIYLYEDLLKKVTYLCHKSEDLCEGKENEMKIIHLNRDFCIGVTLSSNNVIFLNPINNFLLTKWLEKSGKSFLQSDVIIHKVHEIRKCGKFHSAVVPWNKFLETVLMNKVKDPLEKRKNIPENDEVENGDEEEGISNSDDDVVNSEEEISPVKGKKEPRKRKSSEENYERSDESLSKKLKKRKLSELMNIDNIPEDDKIESDDEEEEISNSDDELEGISNSDDEEEGISNSDDEEAGISDEEEGISNSDDDLVNSEEEISPIKGKKEPRKRKSSEGNYKSDENLIEKLKKKKSEENDKPIDNNSKLKKKKSLNESDMKENTDKNKKKRSHDSMSKDEVVKENSKITKFIENSNLKESQAAKQLKEKKLKELETLSLENIGGFDWNATPSDLAKTVSMGKLDLVREDSDDEVVIKKKLTPAERKAAKFEAERMIREKEEELLRCEENPQSADHFDRLVLAKPNDSKLWIQYMAFHLQATDIDKARSIARRALKQINVREEQERLNIWIALLNLENLYGTSETFDKTLAEALKYNDDFQVYMKALGMYCDSQRVTDLEKLTNHLVRKFKDNLNCWLECQSALMKVGLTEKARTFLQRSLRSLPQKEHINLISRFALLENKHGFHEQAQSLFENLLTSYPQRIDLWNVYVDMLVKSNLIDLARNVLERIQSHKLPVRKMRAVYKKWLQFEEKHGTNVSVELVRKAAEKYIKEVLNVKDDIKNDDENSDEPTDDDDQEVEEDDDQEVEVDDDDQEVEVDDDDQEVEEDDE